MGKIAVLLSVLALGVAVWQTVEADGLREDLLQAKNETASVRGDLIQVRQDLSEIRSKAEARPLLPGPAVAAAEGPTPEEDGPTLVPLGASPEVLARAVQDLEKRVSAHETRVEDLEKKTDEVAARTPKRLLFLRNVDQASSALGLTPRQKTDLERVVDDTKRDLDALYDTPNDDGQTFREVSKPKPLTSGKSNDDVGQAITVFMSSFADIQKFKETKVPGSNETYAQAEQRIRSRGTHDARDLLTPDQQKTWDQAHPEALFGSMGLGNVFSFEATTTTTTDR